MSPVGVVITSYFFAGRGGSGVSVPSCGALSSYRTSGLSLFVWLCLLLHSPPRNWAICGELGQGASALCPPSLRLPAWQRPGLDATTPLHET